jgi:hypothetical protein
MLGNKIESRCQGTEDPTQQEKWIGHWRLPVLGLRARGRPSIGDYDSARPTLSAATRSRGAAS